MDERKTSGSGVDRLCETALARLNERLEQRQRELVAQIASLEAPSSDALASEGEVHDFKDRAEAAQTSDNATALLNHARVELAQVKRALGRMKEDTYGRCESCDVLIAQERLWAYPMATRCAQCETALESRD